MEIEGMQFLNNKKFEDARGTFERIFDRDQLTEAFEVKQTNLSTNPKAGTLRGMHYQVKGPPENKYMTLISGSIFLVVIDLRKNKSSYLSIFQKYLYSTDKQSIFVPVGCATGWITLEDNSKVLYQMSAKFDDCTYGGLRYNDPNFQIDWPKPPTIISKKDLSWPNYRK